MTLMNYKRKDAKIEYYKDIYLLMDVRIHK